MKKSSVVFFLVFACLMTTASAGDTQATPVESIFSTKPLGITLSVKMVGPYMQAPICKSSVSSNTKLSAIPTKMQQKIQMLISADCFRHYVIGVSLWANWVKLFYSHPLEVPFPPDNSW